MLERHDLAIENYFVAKVPRLLRNLDELIGHPAQVARKNFDALAAAMQLRANAVELVFDVNGVDFVRHCRETAPRSLPPSVPDSRAYI